MKIYAITFEYSYANNNSGGTSPDEAGGIVGLFEDEDDATAVLSKLEEKGRWGDFSKRDDNDGWSDSGYILHVEAQSITPSSKPKG